MKEEIRHHQAIRLVVTSGFKRLLLLTLLFSIYGGITSAQCLMGPVTINPGEKINYNIHFKWGLLNPKAGNVQISYEKTRHEYKDAYLFKMIFKTAGVAEKVYKTRDTLTNIYSADHILLKAAKYTNEKDRYNIDETTFSYRDNKTYARMHRYNLERTKVDTTYVAEGCVLDMLSSVFFIRNLDWNKLQLNDSFAASVVSGRSMVKTIIRYKGQRILNISETIKYNTHYFSIDVDDDAIESNSTEVWISDDRNHIPLKIKTKLSIGAAEVSYHSSKGLLHPLTSIIDLKKKR